MMYYVAAFGLLMHILFWGVGLSWWITPQPWRRFWPVFVAPAGMALQSSVVWFGAYAGLPGTESYGRWSELVPVVLLASAVGRGGGWTWRRVLDGGRRWWALGALMLVVLGALVRPLGWGEQRLTTASIGSCDAADYAAGARTFQEFARSERGGLIGQTEVVRVASADNFYDFWLRLNHFTPSALIALNGAVFGLAAYQITGVMTAVLLVLALPTVYWLARTLGGLRPGAALGVSALYGFNPLTWYAVYHVAMGQLVAVPAITLITWAGIVAWRRAGSRWRYGWRLGGVLLVAYVLLLGGYNFILLVCFAPVVGFVGGQVLRGAAWSRVGRWLLALGAPLVMAGAVFAERVLGLAERFLLFRQYDFGWRIPALTPEGWLGLVADETLAAYGPGWFRWAVAAVVLGLFVAGALRAGPRRAWIGFCLIFPIAVGYAYLAVRGAQLGTNASYDGYKLLSVFYPGVLVAACSWLAYLGSPRVWVRGAVWVAVAAIVAGLAAADLRFVDRMKTPPLRVGRELAEVQTLESHPEVGALNMMIPDFWSRLWANSFLLRREQYFSTHTYEGRRNTPLRGTWDLNGGLVQVIPPEERGFVSVNSEYSALDTRSPYFLRARLGEGWYPMERLSRGSVRWHWTKGDAVLWLDNPHPRPRRVICRFNARSVVPRELQIWQNGVCVGRANLGTQLATIALPELTLPPGESTLELRSDLPPQPVGPGDSRPLGFAAYGIKLEVLADGDAAGRP